MTAVLMSQVTAIAEDLAATLRCVDAVRPRPEEALILVRTAMEQCLGALSTLDCWGEANRIPSGKLWRVAGPWLATGSLQDHACRKPLGYAGDHELLAKIMDGYCCSHPLGRFLDHFFQAQPAAEAVRHRTHLISQMVVQLGQDRQYQRTHVVSVGSGPALDVQRGLAQLTPVERNDFEVTLLDICPQALARAREHLSALVAPEKVRCIRTNLGRLHRQQNPSLLHRPADLLVCAGLFDYLRDDVAVAMLRTFESALSEGGEAVVFNFAKGNPSRTYMEWIGNWYLRYRDLEQIQALGDSLAERAYRAHDALPGNILALKVIGASG